MIREDWVETELGKVCEIISGKNQSNVINPNGKFPIYGSGGIIGYADNYLCERGCTIIGRKGTINSPIFVTTQFWNVDTAFGFSPKKQLSEKLLYFFCIYFDFKKLDKSTTIPSLAKRDLLKISIPLPPLPEQRAIVSKIEQLFSELDHGIENLKTAQKQLKVYRQAVLKKAFEGELTREWREQQTDLPSADELLEQIREERESYYQKQMDDWTQSVKEWKKPVKPKIMKELPPLREKELVELSKLPEKWNWIYFAGTFLNSPQNGLYKPADQYGEGIDIIRIDDFYNGKLIKKKGFKKVRLTNDEYKKYSIKNGNILINRVNSIEYLGKCGLVEQLLGSTVFESNIMKIELLESLINPKFVSYYLSSITGIKEIRKNAKHAVNQASINQTDVSLTLYPLCSIQEQSQIVQEIDSRLSVCDKVEQTIKESLDKSEALRQSILKKAFEGRLLSEAEVDECRMEPDWEPAEVLLERIKREKKE